MRRLGSGYLLHELIGRGAFGQVWRGSTVAGDRRVAVKVLRAELADDPEVVARFVQERSALLGFTDPHLVTVRDLVVEGDTLAIVMDLVDGVDLRVYLRDRGKLEPLAAVTLICQVLRALKAVHAAGVIHRDLKPANVLIDLTDPDDPQAQLTDFGVARLAHGPSLTRLTGAIGTPLYMAPELAQREHAQPAADVYSAGVMLYELLHGRPPFSAPHPVALLRAHMEDAPTPIADVPAALWDVIARMLAKNPDARPTADEAEQELGLLASSQFQPSAPPATATSAAVTTTGPGDEATALVPGEETVVTPSRANAAMPAAIPTTVIPAKKAPAKEAPAKEAPAAFLPAIPHGSGDRQTHDHDLSGWSGPAGSGTTKIGYLPTAADLVEQPDGRLKGPGRPGGRRRRRPVIAAAAVMLLAVGAGALALSAGGDNTALEARRPVADGSSAATVQRPAATTPNPEQPAAPPPGDVPPPTQAAMVATSDANPGTTTGSRNTGGSAASSGRAPVARQSSAAAAPAPAPAPRTYDMPPGYAGSWSGTVSQPGSAGYTVKLSLTNGDIGDYVGRASYPELGCVADLYLTDVANGAIRVQGKLVVNSYGNCVAATLDLALRSSSAMNYLAQSPGVSGSAQTVLNR